MTSIHTRCCRLAALAGAATLAVGAACSFAQAPPGSPPGPSPGAPRPGGGPPAILPSLPTEPPLTPAQELAASLTPPGPGGLIPRDPPGPDAPRPSSGPRDLTGTWYHAQALEFRMQRDMYGFRLPFTMTGAKVLQRRVKSLDEATPFLNASATCRPPGQQWQLDLNMPFQVVEGDGYIEFIFEEYHGRWNVVMDPARYPRPAAAEYMGYSVGHWDGDTLVVETDGFKQALWLDVDGTPLSADGKMTHRIRRVDHGDGKPFLEIMTTFKDPRYYTNPWSAVRYFAWAPQLAEFLEYDCEEQIGDPNVDSDAGLVPEPAEDPA